MFVVYLRKFGFGSEVKGQITSSISGTIPQNCDTTGIPASSCNPKFVPDSSDYVRYKKQRATNLNYNDTKSG